MEEDKHHKYTKFISSYDEFMPPKDPGYLLIKGDIVVNMGEKYPMDDHNLQVEIVFYILRPCGFSYNNNKKTSLDAAMITDIKSACCTDNDKHEKKIIKYGINPHTIRDLAPKDEFNYDQDDVEEWFPIHNLDRE